jgi:Fe-S cluster assembly protein SufA
MLNKINVITEKKIYPEITLTKKAAQQILFLVHKNPKSIGIRLSIKKSGCAGFRYIMEIIQNKKKEDIKFYQYNATVFVPIKLLNVLKGTTIDFVRNGLNKVFQFYHPNTKNYCGCGESFEITEKILI